MRTRQHETTEMLEQKKNKQKTVKLRWVYGEIVEAVFLSVCFHLSIPISSIPILTTILTILSHCIGITVKTISKSFHSLQSLPVSYFHVILGLPGPRFPSTCMSKAVLTAPLERSTCPYHRFLLQNAVQILNAKSHK